MVLVGLVDQHLNLCHSGHLYFPPLSSAAHPLPSLQGFAFAPFLLLVGICWWSLPASCRHRALEQRGSTTSSCIISKQTHLFST